MIAGHFAFNYQGVRGVAMRSLNRQRTGILWTSYRSEALGLRNGKVTPNLTPQYVATRERIFQHAGTLRDVFTDKIMGHCTIGTALSSLLSNSGPSFHAHFNETLTCFKNERYVLCFDPSYIASRNGPPQLHICLKQNHTPLDQLKGWVHALELARACTTRNTDDPAALIAASYRGLNDGFRQFIEHVRNLGWDMQEGALMTGTPSAVLVSVRGEEVMSGDGQDPLENRKNM